jgi:exopolysaccharide production protein ExoZ
MHYLRAVAALGVVLFHCLGDAGFDFHLGAAGIHLFFVLSGFMMWSIAGHASARPLSFLLGRIRRIVPMYWIGTAVAVGSTFVVPGFYYQATRRVSMIIKSLFFIPQYGVQGGVYPVLYLGWTLQYEMYFYLLFALCLLAPARSRFGLLGAVFVTMAAFGTVLSPQSPALQTYTNPICLEFLAGALLARFGWRIASPPLAVLVALGSAIAFCMSDRYEPALGYFAPLVLAATASGLIVGLLSIENQGRLPHDRFLLLLGEGSFAIYLFQDLGFALALPFVDGANPVVRAFLSAASAATTGVIIHLAIEKPLTSWMKRAGKDSRAVSAAIAPLSTVEQ